MDTSIPQARAAYEAMSAYWSALAADDDQACEALLHPVLRADYPPGAGLAEALRADLRVSQKEAASIRPTNVARMMEPDCAAFICARIRTTSGPDVDFPDVPQQIEAWKLGCCLEDGRWRVRGAPDQRRWESGIEVPIPVTLDGLIH
jgi:hypothetical protein